MWERRLPACIFLKPAGQRPAIPHPTPSCPTLRLCANLSESSFRQSSIKRRLWQKGRLGTEGPGRVALRPVRPGEFALARQFIDPQFLVVWTRQRRHERNDVVDIPFREGEWLNVLVEIGILQTCTLIVV